MRRATLGDVCSIESQLVDPRAEEHQQTLHVGGANIATGTGELLELRSAAEEALISGKYLFTVDDVLYSKIRPYLRKVALPTFAGLCSADIYPLRPKPGVLLRDFLFFLLLSEDFTDYANRVSNRAGMPKVNREQLFSFEFSLPNLSQQRRIVARLRDALARVHELQTLRGANDVTVRGLLPALLHEQFEGHESHRPVPLGEVTLESRYGTSEKCEAAYKGTAVLRIPNVADRRCNFDDIKFLRRRLKEDEALVLREGDLLVVRTNGSPELVGRCAIVPHTDRPYAYASYLIRFRLDAKRVRSKYASYFLSSTQGREQIASRRRTSAGQYNINSEALRTICVPLPPLAVQDSMIERMDRIDLTVRELRARHEAAARLDRALALAVLRRAFAGEL